MDARVVDQVIGSPVFAKLILLTCISALFLYSRQKDGKGHTVAFLVLTGILMVRDLLSSYYPFPGILFISDVLQFCCVIFIFLVPFEGFRLVLVLALVFNAIVAGLFLARGILGLSSELPFEIFGYLLVADVALAGLGGFINRKDRNNAARHLVSRLWPLAVFSLLSYSVLIIILGYGNALILDLFLPLSYVWLFAAAFFSLSIQKDEKISALDYYETAIDALYSLFLGTGSIPGGSHSVLERLNGILVAETGADGGIILTPEGDDFMTIKAYSGFFPPVLPVAERMERTVGAIKAYMEQARFGFEDGLFGDVGKRGKNVFCPRAELDSRFALNSTDEFLRIRSFMAVPLMIEDRILGVCALVRTSSVAGFKETDFDRFKLLANFGSFAANPLLAHEEIAEEDARSQNEGRTNSETTLGVVQDFIQPPSLPRYPGVSAEARSIPGSGGSVAYFDLLLGRKGKLIGVVAESSPQSLRAALVLVMIKAVLQVLGRTDKDMASLLNWANRVLQDGIEQSPGTAIGLVCIDLLSKELEYANAGNLGLIVYRPASRTLDYFSRTTVPLGMKKRADYEQIRLQMRTGDVAVLYTEGVIACTDGQGNQFGRKALGKAIVGHDTSDAAGVLERVCSALYAFAGGGAVLPQTGQTVLVMKME